MEVTRFRSHVLAARSRAEELFEDRESSDSCSNYNLVVSELAERRFNYSMLECLEVYPRIVILGTDIQPDELDREWPQVCLNLLLNLPDERPLRDYNRLALYNLTKN